MSIVAKLNMSKSEFNELYNEFLRSRGYMTKLVNKKINDVSGYLIRSEIDTINGIKFVAIGFQSEFTFNANRFTKALGINRVLTGGKRKLKQLLKTINAEDILSESILNKFKSPTELNELELDYFQTDDYSYSDFYNYIKAFEDKIKKYYNDEKVVILVV